MDGDHTMETYKECLRNHAASLGSYATDGCGEFTPDSGGSLSCAACGCHRNFHRKVTHGLGAARGAATAAVEIMAYGGGVGMGRQQPMMAAHSPESSERSCKKRLRTKFTVDQKEKMLCFAGKLGWKLQRKDAEDEIERFCRGIGISRKVFKVWMHNHKNAANSGSQSNGNASTLTD